MHVIVQLNRKSAEICIYSSSFLFLHGGKLIKNSPYSPTALIERVSYCPLPAEAVDIPLCYTGSEKIGDKREDTTMKITFLTIFPQLFDSFLAAPIPQRAVKKGVLELEVVDIKDFSPGSFRHIDDSPFGGGPGMVMRCQPVLDALSAVKKEEPSGKSETDASSNAVRSGEYMLTRSTVTAALSPAGATFTQQTAHRFAGIDHLILICGHYEGMDERIYRHVDEEVSIGDFILTGGELAAMAVADAVIRLLPGAIRSESTGEESFENGLLEYPQYTQPAVYDGESVPDVLLSGNHEKIRKWRLKESLRRTLRRRPDLLADRILSDEERQFLDEISAEETASSETGSES